MKKTMAEVEDITAEIDKKTEVVPTNKGASFYIAAFIVVSMLECACNNLVKWAHCTPSCDTFSVFLIIGTSCCNHSFLLLVILSLA